MYVCITYIHTNTHTHKHTHTHTHSLSLSLSHKHLVLEPQHRCSPRTRVAVPDNRVHDVLVPPAEVVDAVLPAVFAMLATGPHVPVERLALSRLVKVVTVRVNSQKAHQRKEL